MKIQLQILKGPHKGRSFEFDQHDTFLVGRGQKAHFRLSKEDPYFSRIHFMIEMNPPACRLLDLNSRNGTYVNRQKVQITDLKDGDLIRGGKTVMKVILHNDRVTRRVGRQNLAEAVAPQPNRESASSVQPTADHHASGSAQQKRDHLPGNYRQLILEQEQPIPGIKLVQKLGSGGMGTVHQAIRETDDAIIALKSILPQTATNERERAFFLREAEILENLRHNHIVAFQEMGQVGEMLYFVMEYVPGCDAHDLIRQENKSLQIARACRLMTQVLDALEYAHGKGFVHRDIKPSNLLVKNPGSKDEEIKVADFGLARLYESSKMSGLTMTDHIGGTPQFMSPEQVSDYRNVGPAADQYAAAATLYYLLTGKYLFNFKKISGPSDLAQQLLLVLHEKPIPIQQHQPDIPDDLAELLSRALNKEPENRFPSVTQLKAALLPFC